jgi:hypothetical protein
MEMWLLSQPISHISHLSAVISQMQVNMVTHDAWQYQLKNGKHILNTDNPNDTIYLAHC